MSNKQSIFSVLEESVKRFPHHEAIYDGCWHLTYKALYEKIESITAGLLKIGIKKGDKVIVCLPNWHEFVIIYFALAKIGAILIPGNPSYQKKEWNTILQIANIRAVFCSKMDEQHEVIVRDKLMKNNGHIITVRFIRNNMLSFDDLRRLGEGQLPIEPAVLEQDDVFSILFTSGTTGMAKGVMLTHGNFIYSARNVVKTLQCTAADRFLVPVPFSHVFGLIPGILAVCMSGGKMITMEKFDAMQSINLIETHQITVQFGVPTMFIMQLNAIASKTDFSSLRTGIIAGSTCSDALINSIRAKMGCNIIVSYGATETAAGVTYTQLNDQQNLSGTVGRAIMGTEIKIVDENRDAVPVGTMGELACRGQGICKGYYQMSGNILQTIDDEGWHYTEDLAKIDEKGNVFIVGRKKDLIIRGGYNIYPREIEEVFHTHSHVEDVSIVSLPDTVLGEVTCAAIKLTADSKNQTEAAMKDFIKDKVAKYKIPDHILFVEEFLLSQTGKINKKVLRELCKNRLSSVLR